MGKRDERLKERIREIAAEYLNRNSNKTSLITVTRVDMSSDGKQSTIFITVLPEDKEEEALSFARRERTPIREKIIKDLKIGHPPFLEVDIDRGEKNRQRIDEISNEEL